MNKLAIIGYFAGGNPVSDGQGVKTKILTEEIEQALGKESVLRIDTFDWRRNPLALFWACIKAVRTHKNVVLMTDSGGIKVFPWLLRLAGIGSSCRISYVVIGGWLVHFLKNRPWLAKCLKGLHNVFVETQVMEKGLEALGFSNVKLMVNCKPLVPLEEGELVYSQTEPYRFCIFSRVMIEKGIEDAVEAVRTINTQFGRSICSLDIYGHVDARQQAWFDNLVKTFPSDVRYCDVVPYGESVQVVKKYFALLFPTKFFTEGIPGTIIDAYAAGVPVVASAWESHMDIIDNGYTGLTYSFGDREALIEAMKKLICNPQFAFGMKTQCLEKAKEYLPQNVIHILLDSLQ